MTDICLIKNSRTGRDAGGHPAQALAPGVHTAGSTWSPFKTDKTCPFPVLGENQFISLVARIPAVRTKKGPGN